jgi:hypothetical protein
VDAQRVIFGDTAVLAGEGRQSRKPLEQARKDAPDLGLIASLGEVGNGQRQHGVELGLGLVALHLQAAVAGVCHSAFSR